MDFLKHPNFNFIRWRWHALAASLTGRSNCTTMSVPPEKSIPSGTPRVHA